MMTLTRYIMNYHAQGGNMDITQLIMRAPFLSEKEKFMWIKIAKKLPDTQKLKLADIFLDEENKRKLVQAQVGELNEINQKYLQDLKILNRKYGLKAVQTNEKIGTTEAQRRMLDELGDL